MPAAIFHARKEEGPGAVRGLANRLPVYASVYIYIYANNVTLLMYSSELGP